MRRRYPSRADPFVLNDSLPNGQGALPYRQTAGLTLRSQAFNSGLKNLILIGAGQSQGTTLLPTLYTPSNSSVIDDFNIYDGASYAIGGPLLGTQYTPTMGPGNVFARLADTLITGGFDRVIVIPCAIAGSTAADWATGTLSDRLPVAIRRLASRGYVAGATGLSFAISWWQGETDGTNATTAISYTASMNTVLANAQAAGFSGSSCRFFINKETWVGGVINTTIQGAQVALANGTTIFAGGDVDSLNSSNRQVDNTHFNDAGGAAAATLVYNAMHASGAPY